MDKTEQKMRMVNSELQDLGQVSPFALTQHVIGNLALFGKAISDCWADELRAIALAAAAAGDFKSAVDGYAEIGRSMGKTGPAQQSQHIHFHEAEVVREASTEQLEARLQHIREKHKAQSGAPAHNPSGPNEPDATEAAEFLGGGE